MQDQLLTFLKLHVSSAHMVESAGKETVIALPCSQPMVMHGLLKELASKKAAFNIQQFSLTAMDMEEV